MVSPELWIHSAQCAARIMCRECRTSTAFRTTLFQQRAVSEIDFPCPYGFTETSFPELPMDLPILHIVNGTPIYDLPKIWGPRLWSELHTSAREWDQNKTDMSDIITYLENFANHIPCTDCRKHWDAAIAAHPLDETNYSAWTVTIHNFINRILGKPIFPHDS
ncbi:MAG: ERV1/ALR-related protein [Chthoniobacterales bacterium]